MSVEVSPWVGSAGHGVGQGGDGWVGSGVGSAAAVALCPAWEHLYMGHVSKVHCCSAKELSSPGRECWREWQWRSAVKLLIINCLLWTR